MPVPVEPEPMQPPETPMPAMEEAAEAPEELPEQAAPMEQIRTLPRDLPPGMPDVPPAVPSTANGWLKVIVRTGNNAMPLAGVTIMISSHDTGTMRLEQVAITNESGETERIPLPAPELAESLHWAVYPPTAFIQFLPMRPDIFGRRVQMFRYSLALPLCSSSILFRCRCMLMENRIRHHPIPIKNRNFNRRRCLPCRQGNRLFRKPLLFI